MKKRILLKYLSRKGWKNFIKHKKARDKRRKKFSGELRHQLMLKEKAKKQGKKHTVTISKRKPPLPRLTKKPELSDTIKYLSKLPELFSRNIPRIPKDGKLIVPECFSLTDEYESSFIFLKQLFLSIYTGNFKNIDIDYSKCKRIDVDAQVCMDIMLFDFIDYINKCIKRGYEVWPSTIRPINYSENIAKILYSVGSFNHIKGTSIKFPGLHTLPLLKSNNLSPKVWSTSEVHQTSIVKYITDCLATMNRELNTDSITELYKVLGEVMNNAEEHSSLPFRYAIGMFEEFDDDNNEHFGTFNFSILNFGETIYDKFKSPDCLSTSTVVRMKELSDKYTNRGLFRRAKFEEQTLWTLYALQEGVTSTGAKRGNGSIGYIENFFKLKGDMSVDNVSKLVILSGNTRITFDGVHDIKIKNNTNGRKGFKMITFNDTGNIEDLPDEKYVTFAPHYFPGTIITARILIKHDNTK